MLPKPEKYCMLQSVDQPSLMFLSYHPNPNPPFLSVFLVSRVRSRQRTRHAFQGVNTIPLPDECSPFLIFLVRSPDSNLFLLQIPFLTQLSSSDDPIPKPTTDRLLAELNEKMWSMMKMKKQQKAQKEMK